MTAIATSVVPARRSGIGHLWDSYRSMLRFELLSLRDFLPPALVIQLLMGCGMAVMYGFYFGDLPAAAKTFLVSGIPALALFPIGFVMVPVVITDQRWEETYDYIWSLPVPRSAAAGATFTIFTALALPGTAVALVVSAAAYGVELHPSLQLIPALLLSSAMATAVGYAMGHGIKRPETTNLFTNLIIFLVLMFSPIVVPIEIFPGWLAGLHHLLPFWHMANMIRAGLTDGLVDGVGWSYLVAGLWTVASIAIAARVIARRG